MRAAPTITVRGGEHETFDRLVFDWTSATAPVLAKTSETQFTLSFNAAAQAALPKNLVKLKRLGSITQTSNDSLTITLTVKLGNTLKMSRAGNKVVADIQAGSSRNIPNALASQDNKPDVKTLDLAVGKKDPVKMDDWSENQELSDKPLPAKSDDKKTTDIKTDAKDAKPAPAKAVADKPGAEKLGPGGRPLTIAELAEQEKADAAKPKDTPVDSKEAEDEGQLTPVPAEPEAPPIVTTIKLAAPTEAKFAAFMRGNKFWLAFDKKIETMPTEKDDSTPTTFGPISRYPVNNGEGVIYRIGLAPGQFAALTHRDDKTLSFSVYSKEPILLPLSLPITRVTAKDGKHAVHIKMRDAGMTLKIKDPDVGDELVIVPTDATTGGTTLGAHFPQFEILSTLNGTAIKLLVDGIDIKSDAKGVDITRAPENLAMTPADNDNNKDQAAEQIFDFKHWARGKPEDFRHLNYEYETQLAETRGADRLGKMMVLAQFMFATNHGREAQGWLDLAAQEFPAVADVPQYILLHGATHVLKREFLSGDQDLGLDGYATEPEVAIWRGYIAAERGDYTRARYFYHLAGPLLYDYPIPYGRMFALSAAETALETGDSITAQSLITHVRAEKDLNKQEKGQLDYLAGLHAALNNENEDAMRYWQRAIKGGDQLYANKARYKMVLDGLAKKTLEPKDAVKTLADLCVDWRGDNLELNALMLLADLQMKNNQPRAAFEAWQTVMRYFETKPQAEAARQSIAQNFVALFADNKQASLPPVETLGLYKDFIGYAPKNDQGQQITQNLINRLASLEMYKEAADILHETVFNQPPGLGQPQAALQMAKFLLLDDQPQAMRDVLATVDPAVLNTTDQVMYHILQARADFQDKKYDSALQQIGALDNDTARRLRADIFWKSQNWDGFAKLAPSLMGETPADGTLTPIQARLILQQAIAISMLQDTVNLEALRTTYGAKMETSELAPSFRLITRPPKGSELQSLSAIQSRLGEIDMFKDFLAPPKSTAPGKETAPPVAATTVDEKLSATDKKP